MLTSLRSFLPVLFTLSALALAACGSDSESEDSTETEVLTETVTTSTEETSTVRDPVSTETAQAFDSAAASYNIASDRYDKAVQQSIGPDGSVDVPYLQSETRQARDSLYAFDSTIRELDFAGYEPELNVLLDAIGAHIASLDMISTGTEAAQVQEGIDSATQTAAGLTQASDDFLFALNNG